MRRRSEARWPEMQIDLDTNERHCYWTDMEHIKPDAPCGEAGERTFDARGRYPAPGCRRLCRIVKK